MEHRIIPFFYLIDEYLKTINLKDDVRAKIYSVDSFPVELCNITREKRSNLWVDKELKGYNASKKRFFYGLKIHMIVTTNKEPIFFYISKGLTHDVTAAYEFLPYMPKNSIVIVDKGYVSNKLDNFLTNLGIKLSPISENIISKYKNSRVLEIDNYKNIFDRKHS
jgi:hypothetical protein